MKISLYSTNTLIMELCHVRNVTGTRKVCIFKNLPHVRVSFRCRSARACDRELSDLEHTLKFDVFCPCCVYLVGGFFDIWCLLSLSVFLWLVVSLFVGGIQLSDIFIVCYCPVELHGPWFLQNLCPAFPPCACLSSSFCSACCVLYQFFLFFCVCILLNWALETE